MAASGTSARGLPRFGLSSVAASRVASLAFFVPNSSNLAFFESGWHLNFAFGIFLVSGIFLAFYQV